MSQVWLQVCEGTQLIDRHVWVGYISIWHVVISNAEDRILTAASQEVGALGLMWLGNSARMFQLSHLWWTEMLKLKIPLKSVKSASVLLAKVMLAQ